MGMITFNQFLGSGATFSTLIYAVSETVIPVVFGLWCAHWLYKILIDFGGDR